MSRQGSIQSGTGVYHVMMRGINRQNPVKAGVVSRVCEYASMNSPHGMNTLAELTSSPSATSMSYLAESI